MRREGRPIAVRISGLAGLGKSAVAHHFLDELEQQGDVLVLRGRAYQRESMPYKAVDAIVDSLSRHLMDLQSRKGAVELPSEIWALSHIFPGPPPSAEHRGRAARRRSATRRSSANWRSVRSATSSRR